MSGRVVVVLGLLFPGVASAIDVAISSPSSREPLLGIVEVVVAVHPLDSVRSVELSVDGRPVSRLVQPPFRWIVDVGQSGASHRLVAEALSTADERFEAVLETAALQVDDEIDVELQPLYVTVTSEGSSVDSLGDRAFTVLDEGEEQTLVTFERGDVPLTALLLLDASGSMKGDRLAAALESVRAFLEGMQPLDEAMLLLFSDRVIGATPFTGFSEVVATGLESAIARGGTALEDHLYVGLKLLEGRRGRRVLILLSDGLDNASVLDMREVLERARRSQALVYWLRLPLPFAGGQYSSSWKNDEDYQRELSQLETLVTQSGGQVIPLDEVEGALEAFLDILDELRGQYVLGYYPTERRRNGKWRKVRVRVDRPGLDLRYRQGYVDY